VKTLGSQPSGKLQKELFAKQATCIGWSEHDLVVKSGSNPAASVPFLGSEQ